MGEWSNLTQREKSNIIRFAIKNGVSDINTIRDTFNVYADGGHLHEGTKSDSKLHIPTREEYITQKLDYIQNAALEASRRKTQAQTTPVNIEQVYGKGFVKQILQGYVDSARAQLAALKAQERQRAKSAMSAGFVQGNVNTQLQSERLANAEESLRQAEGMLSGEIEYTPQELNNCMANLSEFFPHGLPYGNQTFAANPQKWGFSLIDTWDAKPGDLVQKIDYSGNAPVVHHAMIYNGVDAEGKHTFNYSNGDMPHSYADRTTGGYGVGKHYPDAVSSDGEHLWDVNVYRYTGTPQDSAQWTNEWLQQYGQNELAKGGKIYIKPSKRGTFTAAATKHGMGVQAFASKVLAHKENYSPAMVKKAVFAHNSKSWKHSTGGPLYPFSFQKNPYWKTPVVRYDEGGVLGHQYGIGDFLSKLFAPTYSGDFSTAFAKARNDRNSYFKWNGNRYSTQWETEKYREEHPEEYVPEFAYTDAMNRIAREENTKLVKNGYIPELDAWQPHKSVEGGAKTIGYGLKLGPHNQAVLDELERNKSDKYPNGYISDAFALQQSANLLRDEYEPLAKKYWNSTFKDDSWDNLSPKMKSIILDYQYNVRGGIKEFPKLMRAIHDKDYDGIKANYKRYANKRELGRNKGIYQDLERLFGGYYSVYNN